MPAGRPKAFAGREELILDAALRTFAARGVATTTIADVAKAGGMGVGAVYRYFGDRAALFRRVVQHAAYRVGEIVRIESAVAATSLADYERQLYRIGDALARLVDAEPDLVRFLLDDARGVDPEVDRMLDGLEQLFADFTAAYLHNGKRHGYLRATLDVPIAARLINATIFEAVRRLGPRSKPKERQKWMHELVQLMLHGVSAR
jgi:AcrR family transcriptional regulator